MGFYWKPVLCAFRMQLPVSADQTVDLGHSAGGIRKTVCCYQGNPQIRRWQLFSRPQRAAAVHSMDTTITQHGHHHLSPLHTCFTGATILTDIKLKRISFAHWMRSFFYPHNAIVLVTLSTDDFRWTRDEMPFCHQSVHTRFPCSLTFANTPLTLCCWHHHTETRWNGVHDVRSIYTRFTTGPRASACHLQQVML